MQLPRTAEKISLSNTEQALLPAERVSRTEPSAEAGKTARPAFSQEGIASVEEDAAAVAQEEGEAAAGSDEEGAADGGGTVEDRGRHLEARSPVEGPVAHRPPIGPPLLLRGVLHPLQMDPHSSIRINWKSTTRAIDPSFPHKACIVTLLAGHSSFRNSAVNQASLYHELLPLLHFCDDTVPSLEEAPAPSSMTNWLMESAETQVCSIKLPCSCAGTKVQHGRLGGKAHLMALADGGNAG